MRILICAVGSHGDVLPFIGLGREFQRRGHEVRLLTSAAYERLADDAGLPFVATSPARLMSAMLRNEGVTESSSGLAIIARGLMETIPRTCQLLREQIDPGRTVIVGSSFALGARLVAEADRVPGVMVHLSPSWVRSEYMAPSLGPLGHLERLPRWFKRGLWKLMDRRFLDPLFTAPLNRLRAGMGLPPVSRVLHEWIHQADLTLGLYPAWFGMPQPDAPPGMQLTGFPLHDHGGDHGNERPLPAEVEAFLAAGDAPIAFTAGTANATSHAFYAASAEACARMGRRGILIAQEASQLPATLPDGVVHFSYVPFKALLPRLAAFVHHGGIGSTSQALLAGVPQLIRPMAFDQFDNASRAVRLGVAKQLLPRRYRAASAAQALSALIGDVALQRRCSDLAQRMAGQDGIGTACDAILQRAGVAPT